MRALATSRNFAGLDPPGSRSQQFNPFCKTETIRQEPASVMKRYSSFTLAFALALSAVAIYGPRINRAASFDGDAYAIKGGTVVTVTGATIQKGTVIIRNGLIEAVGADIPIPGDARVIDASGMTVYPGLIDAYTSIGLGATATPPAQGGRGGGAPARRRRRNRRPRLRVKAPN